MPATVSFAIALVLALAAPLHPTRTPSRLQTPGRTSDRTSGSAARSLRFEKPWPRKLVRPGKSTSTRKGHPAGADCERQRLDNPYFVSADSRFSGKDICAEGKLFEHSGLVYIRLTAPGQIRIVKNKN